MADDTPRIWTHHMAGGTVAECTCRWVSEPVTGAEARKRARALGEEHLRSEHP